MAVLFVHLLPFMVRLITEVFSIPLDYLNQSLFICSEPCSHFKFLLSCNLKESHNFGLGLFISIFHLFHQFLNTVSNIIQDKSEDNNFKSRLLKEVYSELCHVLTFFAIIGSTSLITWVNFWSYHSIVPDINGIPSKQDLGPKRQLFKKSNIISQHFTYKQ